MFYRYIKIMSLLCNFHKAIKFDLITIIFGMYSKYDLGSINQYSEKNNNVHKKQLRNNNNLSPLPSCLFILHHEKKIFEF